MRIMSVSKFPYSKVWDVSVFGCPVATPSNWWPGNTNDTTPCPGNIVFVDLEALVQSFFAFWLDDGGKCYGMYYDVVLVCADSARCSFSNFSLCLPNVPPTEPYEPTVTTQRASNPCPCQPNFSSPYPAAQRLNKR